jgi:hypothetical protein
MNDRSGALARSARTVRAALDEGADGGLANRVLRCKSCES